MTYQRRTAWRGSILTETASRTAVLQGPTAHHPTPPHIESSPKLSMIQSSPNPAGKRFPPTCAMHGELSPPTSRGTHWSHTFGTYTTGPSRNSRASSVRSRYVQILRCDHTMSPVRLQPLQDESTRPHRAVPASVQGGDPDVAPLWRRRCHTYTLWRQHLGSP